MGEHNSIGLYSQILQRLVVDIATVWYDPIDESRRAVQELETVRDLKTIRDRVSSEGVSFLTKTLPALGKAFDRALQGAEAFNAEGWEKYPFWQMDDDQSRFAGTGIPSAIPKFLGYLFKRVFNPEGWVRSDACPTAVKHVRQVSQLLYKLEVKHEEESIQKVLDSFTGVQEELKKLVLDPSDAVINQARRLIARVLSGLSPREIIPRHGPGSVATGERGGEKSSFSRIFADSEREYPFTEYFTCGLSQVCDQYHTYEALEIQETGTAKVVLVPKDSRGPRLISAEPLEKQWLQQGQRQALYDRIESHPLTRGHVNFVDQGVNRRLALESSRTGARVTLDMKEASDRVSLQLVKLLLADSPQWLDALVATRSGRTRMPNGTVLELQSFAPMGSSVCFPVEALVFWALAVSILVVHKPIKTSVWRATRKAAQSVYVYGDDIICDAEDYGIVMQEMERYGLLFNRSKCCVSGLFRESCGCDAYNGVDVTPVRLRKTWNHSSPFDPVQLQSYVEFSNSMYLRGYRGVALYVEGMVEDLYGPLPYLEYKEESEWSAVSVPGRDARGDEIRFIRNRKPVSQRALVPPGRVIGFCRPDVNPRPVNLAKGIPTRFNRYLHVYEVKGYVVKPGTETYTVDGWESLTRTLTCGATGLPNGVYADPHSSRLMWKWEHEVVKPRGARKGKP